jgi:hypothetical protein
MWLTARPSRFTRVKNTRCPLNRILVGSQSGPQFRPQSGPQSGPQSEPQFVSQSDPHCGPQSGPQNLSGPFGEQKTLLPLLESEPRTLQPVAQSLQPTASPQQTLHLALRKFRISFDPVAVLYNTLWQHFAACHCQCHCTPSEDHGPVCSVISVYLFLLAVVLS